MTETPRNTKSANCQSNKNQAPSPQKYADHLSVTTSRACESKTPCARMIFGGTGVAGERLGKSKRDDNYIRHDMRGGGADGIGLRDGSEAGRDAAAGDR